MPESDTVRFDPKVGCRILRANWTVRKPEMIALIAEHWKKA